MSRAASQDKKINEKAVSTDNPTAANTLPGLYLAEEKILWVDKKGGEVVKHA